MRAREYYQIHTCRKAQSLMMFHYTRFEVPLTAGVPVPSRLYFPEPSPALPLSGMRIVVKDNIDLKGVRTSAGNKAFRELYGPRTANAPCIQLLLKAGAVVVGKAKTVPFASGANARDWIDYQPSFNIRADGYQDPGCSSAGSASAIAAYEWLDITIATDSKVHRLFFSNRFLTFCQLLEV